VGGILSITHDETRTKKTTHYHSVEALYKKYVDGGYKTLTATELLMDAANIEN
jgi:hypothetical protein